MLCNLISDAMSAQCRSICIILMCYQESWREVDSNNSVRSWHKDVGVFGTMVTRPPIISRETKSVKRKITALYIYIYIYYLCILSVSGDIILLLFWLLSLWSPTGLPSSSVCILSRCSVCSLAIVEPCAYLRALSWRRPCAYVCAAHENKWERKQNRKSSTHTCTHTCAL